MPLIVPQKEDFTSAAKEIFAEAGLLRKQDVETSKRSEMSDELNQIGLTRQEIAFQLKMLATAAEKEETKLSSCKLALQLHGDLKDQDVKTGVQIVFKGADDATLQILIPR